MLKDAYIDYARIEARTAARQIAAAETREEATRALDIYTGKASAALYYAAAGLDEKAIAPMEAELDGLYSKLESAARQKPPVRYMSEKELGERYGYTAATICRHVSCMRQIDYYAPYIAGEGAGTRVELGAYKHYMDNRRALGNKETARFVRPYGWPGRTGR